MTFMIITVVIIIIMIRLTTIIEIIISLSQAKEVAEVQETLAEFLKLASSKYPVVAFVPPRPMTDKEFFGLFGCEYWGTIII